MGLALLAIRAPTVAGAATVTRAEAWRKIEAAAAALASADASAGRAARTTTATIETITRQAATRAGVCASTRFLLSRGCAVAGVYTAAYDAAAVRRAAQ